MKNIYIVGAGDFGREMESALEMQRGWKSEFLIAGYLDDNAHSLEGYQSDYKIVGSPLNFKFSENDFALLAISNLTARRKISENLRGKVSFFTFIDDTVVVNKYVKVGEGSIICSKCFIGTNTNIETFVIANVGSIIGHDCRIGSHTNLMANVDLGGKSEIGENVFIGTKSTIIPRRKIKDNIIIGAGSVVVRDLRYEGTFFGNPVKKMRFDP